VEKAMAARALPLAQLLAGEMPADIEEVFAACGLSLFPRSAAELKPSCSCPDWEPVCKHVAATYYLLAERFDEDPFAIFAWRGRERDELLDHLRSRRAKAAPSGDSGGDRHSPQAQPGMPSARRPLPRVGEPCNDLKRFWHAGEGLVGLEISPLASQSPDALLRELGPLEAERGAPAAGDLVELLAPVYAQLAHAAERRALE
jgi:uncharacterized Zn finger protein